MNPNRSFGLWKAIAFLTVVISSLLFFSSCKNNEPVSLKPTVVIDSIADVTTNQAVIIASVVPNGEATVSLEYYPVINPEQKVESVIPTKYNGTEAVSVTIPLSGLEPNTSYNFTIKVINEAGSVNKSGTFSTQQLTKAVAVIKPATNVTRFEATLNATIIANQPDTKISFKYWAENSEATPKTKTLSTLYNGTDSINVSADVSDLPLNTKIYYQVEVENKAGIVISNKSSFETYAVVDYDGNMYHTVKIGEQVWTVENLRTRHYNNGDPIVYEPLAANWGTLKTGAYTAYNNSSEMAEKYGYIYNYLAVSDLRGIAPEGWRIPSGDDFEELKAFLGGYYPAGPALMNQLGWPKTVRSITNSTGFSALPNGGIVKTFKTGLYEYSGGNETAAFITNQIFGGYLIMVIISAEKQYLSTGGLYDHLSGAGIRLIKQ
ncbi:MAG: FISUMP domain-containing protein [Paludibacter sp.]